MKDNLKIDFDEFVETFNQKGKSEAVLMVKEKYNLSFQQFRRRLSNLTSYYYNKSLRIYQNRVKIAIETEFMSIDELDCCKSKNITHKELVPLSGPSSSVNFEEIINELIKDRLMELSKYVSINRETRNLIINTKNLKKDYFNLVEI